MIVMKMLHRAIEPSYKKLHGLVLSPSTTKKRGEERVGGRGGKRGGGGKGERRGPRIPHYSSLSKASPTPFLP
jgi:hypothetical protein